MIPAHEALERLRKGNRRFVADEGGSEALVSGARRQELVGGQDPCAVVLGCSDSRVPAEIIFDQGLGDLFVIRVAGNVVAPSQIGSVEFAVEELETRLVVVLGHSDCGAVRATVEQLKRPAGDRSPNLSALVDRIRPSVETLMESGVAGGNTDSLVRAAVRANVRASVDHLRHGSAIIERQVQQEGVLVVGAEYSLESGEVEFFEDGDPS